MNYIYYALLAAIAFAASQVLNKLLSKHSIENRDSLVAYFMLTTSTFALFLFPFVPKVLPELGVLLMVFIAMCAFLLGYYFFFTGIFHADASSVAPLFQLQAGLIGVLAFIFLGERFPVQNYLYLGLMLIGGVLVSFTEKMSPKTFLSKGILLVLLMQVCHAVSNLVVGFALKSITPIQLLFWEDIMMFGIFLIFVFVRRPKMQYKPTQIAPMFLASYIVGLGVISLFTAFAQNLTISSVLGLLSAPIVFVISVLASHFSPTFLEHHSAKVYAVRSIGLLIIMFGAYQITIG